MLKVLRPGVQHSHVEMWEEFLLGYGFVDTDVDKIFDVDSVKFTKEFQRAHGLKVDGWVGDRTWSKAIELGLDVFEDDTAENDGPNWPPAPNAADLLPIVGTDGRMRAWGDMRYKPAGTTSNPEAIAITNDWAGKNVVKVVVPQVARIPGMQHEGRIVGDGPSSVQIHRSVLDSFVALWDAWEDAGLLDRIITWAGTWSPRFIRGSRTSLSNHCLPPTETVWTTEGPVPIGDLKGSVAKVWSFAEGNAVVGSVSRFFDNGTKPLLRIRATGREFRCTPDHPVLVLRKRTLPKTAWIQHKIGRGQVRALYWTEMVQAGDLCIGDRIVGSKQIPNPLPGKDVDLDWAEILGLFLGDGCIHHLHGKAEYASFCFPKGDRVRDHVFDLLVRHFGEPPKQNDKALLYYREHVWERFLPYDRPATKKDLPVEVWSWSAAAKARLLLGLLYSDGTVAKAKSSSGGGFGARYSFKLASRPLVESIRMLLTALGFRVGAIHTEHGGPRVIAGVPTVSNGAFGVHAIDVRGVLRPEADPLYLARVEAASKPDAGTSHCYGYEEVGPDFTHHRVTAVDQIGAAPVVDIEVDEHHNFITGGVVVSNCFATAFDINAPWNGLRRVPALVGKHGCVRELVPIANELGWYWGGHFTRRDGMHFEATERAIQG